jgi:hypothetical protein
VEFIAEALASVGDSERELVALLYGFEGHRRTVEEIAQQRGLSPARIDHAAKSVLRRMRLPACARLLRQALASADERIWSALGGSAGVVYKTESSPSMGARLPGELLFAIESQYGSMENWLLANARESARAWYRSPYPETEIDEIGRSFDAPADERPLPAPLASLAARMGVEPRALETAIRLGGRWQIHSGYVVKVPFMTRAPRSIRLHRILSGTHPEELVRARPLAAEYRSKFADDACTPGDVELAMGSFPHLFLRVGDLGWCGIGKAGSQEPAPDDSDREVIFHRWSEERKSGQETPDRDVLRQILEEQGPSRFAQICALVRARSGGKIPATSTHAYLVNCDEFIRLAPGVYGLSGEEVAADRLAAARRLLLNRGSCLQYVLARQAGEPLGAYPLWTPAMEADWCEWAQAREKSLLGSLLSVVEPSAWPADSYKDIWLWKKECLGYYQFEKKPRYPLIGAPVGDVLAMVKCALWRGAANWVLANRVTGQRILNRDAASLMALLIGVGAVLPPAHWQKPHEVAPAVARGIDAMLSEELHRKGSLSWDGEAGSALLEQIAKTIDRGETGWVAVGEMRKLLERLREPESADG